MIDVPVGIHVDQNFAYSTHTLCEREDTVPVDGFNAGAAFPGSSYRSSVPLTQLRSINVDGLPALHTRARLGHLSFETATLTAESGFRTCRGVYLFTAVSARARTVVGGPAVGQPGRGAHLADLFTAADRP